MSSVKKIAFVTGANRKIDLGTAGNLSTDAQLRRFTKSENTTLAFALIRIQTKSHKRHTTNLSLAACLLTRADLLAGHMHETSVGDR
jgi:hypothetical protein